jgi:hypothetical protein
MFTKEDFDRLQAPSLWKRSRTVATQIVVVTTVAVVATVAVNLVADKINL